MIFLIIISIYMNLCKKVLTMFNNVNILPFILKKH